MADVATPREGKESCLGAESATKRRARLPGARSFRRASSPAADGAGRADRMWRHAIGTSQPGGETIAKGWRRDHVIPLLMIRHAPMQWWSQLVDACSRYAVVPVLVRLHLDKLAGDPREIAEAALIALLQVAIIAGIFRPLESLVPAERWSDRKLTRVDRQYTLLMLLGIFPLFSYLILTPISNYFGDAHGGPDDSASKSPLGLLHWFPWLGQHPLLLFVAYYIVYDLVYYWMHRVQHALPWWWALHSMHHSQRQMSCWTNDRGSLVDGFLQSMVLAGVGLVIGVAPAEFAWLMLLGELVQNFSHANVRLGFGPIFGRLFVDPRFHRLHHMVAEPHRPGLYNCNFGQVFSIWDVLFDTALYGEPLHPTGVADPMVDADNRHGLIGLHWVAFRRFWGAIWRISGWRLGEVSFDENYRPMPAAHETPIVSPDAMAAEAVD